MKKILESEIKELVGIDVGQSSMCWNPRPSSQVFESELASEIVEQLTRDIMRLIDKYEYDTN